METDHWSINNIEDFCTRLKVDKDHDVIIYDPYIISTEDLKALGIKNLVRIRRPGWGLGKVSGYIEKLKYRDLEKFFESNYINLVEKD